MTGRDLIIHILQNGLEDKVVFENGKFIGFITEDEAAAKFEVGVSTIRAWYSLGFIKGIALGDVIFIMGNAADPRKKNC